MENAANEQGATGISLGDYLRVARMYWKGIVAITLATVLLSAGWMVLQTKVYSADSSGIVVTGGGDNLGLSLAGDNLAKSKAKNYQSVASSRLVAERVISELGLKESAEALAGTVKVSVPVDTTEIRISATSTDPAAAQRIADAWVRALAAQVHGIETMGAAADGTTITTPAVQVVPMGTAALPSTAIFPNVKLTLGVGFLSGLVLALVYALVRSRLDRRIRSAQEIERAFSVPVIGTIPTDDRLAGKSAVLASLASHQGKSSHAMAEALRELRTNLNFIDVDNPPRIMVVTSSIPSEGKSTLTANLAVTMAAAGENVVVVDGDLRRPTVVDVFNLVPGAGVTDVLSGRADIEDVLQPWGQLPNLQVMGSGRIPPNPSELLGSKAMQKMLLELAKHAIVLIDAPPLLPVTDAAILSRSADGTIVVVRNSKTTKEEFGKALGNLGRVQGHVLGAILNCVPTSGAGSYSYGYYGSYGTDDAGKGTSRGQAGFNTASRRSRGANAGRAAKEVRDESGSVLADEFEAVVSGSTLRADRVLTERNSTRTGA